MWTLAESHDDLIETYKHKINHEKWNNKKISLSAVYEQEPLGTGGALVNVIRQKKITGNVLVINGDTLFKFEF